MSSSRFSIAVHVLTLLAKADGVKMKSDCIAESVNTNPVVIRRLLSELSQADLVESQTGACGGTLLVRNPEDINLFEVYRIVEKREVFALHRQTPNQHCDVGKYIEKVMERLQNEVDSAVEVKLSQYSLRDILAVVEKKCDAEKKEFIVVKKDDKPEMNIWLM